MLARCGVSMPFIYISQMSHAVLLAFPVCSFLLNLCCILNNFGHVVTTVVVEKKSVQLREFDFFAVTEVAWHHVGRQINTHEERASRACTAASCSLFRVSECGLDSVASVIANV